MKRINIFIVTLIMVFDISACEANYQDTDININEAQNPVENINIREVNIDNEENTNNINVPENFILVKGGTFTMSSPTTEA